MYTSYRYFFFILVLILASCKTKSGAPTAPTTFMIEIDTTIIPYDSLGALGGSGFYYKASYWQGSFNPYWGDSVLKMLLDSNFIVDEFWYPQTPGICADPRIHEREIAKLDQPDTSIYRIGYQPLDSGYADYCIRSWRYYKINRIRVGA